MRQRTTGKLAGKLGVKAKEPTVRNELLILRSCLNFCAEYEDDQENTLIDKASIRKFDLPEEGKPRDRWLTLEEIDRLYAAARRRRTNGKLSRVELFLYLAIGTAGRERAILDLTYDRVNFETRSIDLNDGERLPNDKNRAAVWMSDDLFAILRQALAESDQSIPLDRRLVMISKTSVWLTIQRVVYEAGLAPVGWVPPKGQVQPKATGISPHILRHTAATHMAVKGIPLWLIAKYLGNTLAMVEKVYAKHQLEHLKAAAAVMSRGVVRPVPMEIAS